LPYDYRFQIVAEGDYSYGVDRSMIDGAVYTTNLSCKSGCTDLNKMFAEGKTKEISFFGHGGADGLALGQTTRGSLAFYYGYDYWQAKPFPAFEGTMLKDARVNLFECYGATNFHKVKKITKDVELEPIPFADVVPSEPSLIHPIAEAIAKKWKVKVLGFDWLCQVSGCRI